MPRNAVVVFDEAHNIDNICIDRYIRFAFFYGRLKIAAGISKTNMTFSRAIHRNIFQVPPKHNTAQETELLGFPA